MKLLLWESPMLSILASAAYISTLLLSSVFPVLNAVRSIAGFVILAYILGLSVRTFLKSFKRFSAMPKTQSIEVSFLMSSSVARTFHE